MVQNDHFLPWPDPASVLEIARQAGLPPPSFLFVGDSAVDMQIAIATNMHAVGVAWGFRAQKELTEAACLPDAD